MKCKIFPDSTACWRSQNVHAVVNFQKLSWANLWHQLLTVMNRWHGTHLPSCARCNVWHGKIGDWPEGHAEQFTGLGRSFDDPMSSCFNLTWFCSLHFLHAFVFSSYNCFDHDNFPPTLWFCLCLVWVCLSVRPFYSHAKCMYVNDQC